MTSRTFRGLPVPDPAPDGIGPLEHVFDAAIEARSLLLAYPGISSLRLPLAWAAEQTAYGWCNAGRHNLTTDVQDLTFLTGAIVEILALDPVTREHLRAHRLAVPACGWCRGKRGLA